jgi:hypothetical protein
LVHLEHLDRANARMPERPNAAYLCANHPHVATSQVCGSCGRPFCPGCLTEIGGKVTCGWCRDLHLARLQPRAAAVNPATVVLWARIFNGLSLLFATGIMGLFGTIFAAPLLFGRQGASGSDAGVLSALAGGMGIALLAAWFALLPPTLFLGPGRPWAWTWQLIAIIISGLLCLLMLGSLGIMLLPAAIALAVFWLRPEVRAYCEGR